MAGAFFFLGVALLLTLILLGRAIATADTRQLARGVRVGGGVAAAGVALYLVVSGRWPMAMLALSFMLPFAMRWPGLRERFGSARRPRPGKLSEVETAMLRMTLDHDSGEMTGTVTGGSQAGRELASLGRTELEALLAECRREDPQSAALLENYLDRRFGADWREPGEKPRGRGRGRGGAGSSGMDRAEALGILGLHEGASPEEIKEAYRRLMTRLHPDAGGSDYLAAKLNQAKDVLLGG